MKVLFVGLNPSPKNTSPDIAFMGSPSGKVLSQWVKEITPDNTEIDFCNISSKVSSDSQNIKSNDIDLTKLSEKIAEFNPTALVVLGQKTKKHMIDSYYIGKVHMAFLPHPSPRNRKLNNKKELKEQLTKAKQHLYQLQRVVG